MMEEDDNTQPTMQSSPFDAIRKVDELGHEFWNAKDLAKLLGYRQYTNFTGAIRKAEIACKESGEVVSDHFLHVKEEQSAHTPPFISRALLAISWSRMPTPRAGRL